jgi:hypothetical protein
MSFAKLKSNRAAELAKLTSQIEKLATGGGDKKADERFWSPTVDKSGNGSAILRFLPAPDGEDLPFIRYWDHGFKGPGGLWYIENSLSSIGKEDPVGEMNRKLWQTEEGKKIVSGEGNDKPGTKRRLHYISNIYVVKDPGNPENEGKVFLYKFGAKIFEKLNAAMHPEFEGEEQINPFDLWEGANFYLRIAKVKGYRNYDKSAFAAKTPLLDSDDEMEAIWKSEYPIALFLDEANFKSYDELKAKLARVMEGSDESTGSTARPSDQQTVKPKAGKTKAAPIQEVESEPEMDDESMSFFKNLAEED